MRSYPEKRRRKGFFQLWSGNFQKELRNSPLWEEMVAKFGEEEAEKLVKQGQVRIALRPRHYSQRTEQAYVSWIKRFILFHNKCHPAEMGAKEIKEFLNHLWAKKPKRLPVVLTREEVKQTLNHLCGVDGIMVNLLYGAGLRLRECL